MSSISEGAKRFLSVFFYIIAGIEIFVRQKCDDFILVTM